jgi:ATP phosphoribosyltransferase regulatory subunit
MTEDTPPNPALLPTGLVDLLPPEAEAEAIAVGRLMKVFHSHGYERVKPPMAEFADGLLAGTGAAMAGQTFRLMDPDTHRMLGLRADMTPQVARIAGTRLAARPRPLRLSYAGQCLRVRGSQVDPNRQVAQAGIELIGPDTPAADAEIVLLAAEALAALGISRISIDLTMPTLAPALLDDAGLTGAARQALTHALDRKDSAIVALHGGPIAGLLTDLLLSAGPVGPAMEVLDRATLGPGPAALRERLRATVAAVQAQAPGLRLTLDLLEFRGLRYHTGLCMTVFAPGHAEELGRGGRYVTGEEAATGLSLFPDAILRVCPPPPRRPRAFLPWGGDAAQGARLRAEGYATINALMASDDPAAEAARLGCTHILRDGAAVPLPVES